MKQGIHPEYHQKCQVTCVCGNTFTTGSTLKEIQVEICSKCHPFFTGKQKLIDTAGRVDKFRERVAEAQKREENSAKRTIEQKEARKKAKEAAVSAQFGEKIALKDLAKANEELAEAKPAKKAAAKKAAPAKKAAAKKTTPKKPAAKKAAAKKAKKKGGAKK